MLLTREEMSFDFGSAKLEPARDKALLGWMMNQFLYGEVTGIQCGHWLYQAPDLDAARFFARQAVEEFQHVDNFLRILDLLGEKPRKANPIVRFLTSGMMPDDFDEHVCLEMAQGEGLVLAALYAVIDTIDHPRIREILVRAVKQEERHVDFGERRTIAALERDPSLRRRLLGLSLVSLFGVRALGRFMRARLPADHPVLEKLPAFLEQTIAMSELRLRRMGVLDRPLAALGAVEKARAVASAYASAALRLPLKWVPFSGPARLTRTYLRDPAVLRRLEQESDADAGPDAQVHPIEKPPRTGPQDGNAHRAP
jgi:bacterioferritin (cytochrome b1)